MPRVDFVFVNMASSDEDVSVPKYRKGMKIPLDTRTQRNPYPQEYDYTRVLQYFSDEEKEDSMEEEDEEGGNDWNERPLGRQNYSFKAK